MQQAILYLQKADPIFKNIIEQYGIPTIPTRPEGFQTLVLLILEQQVSVDSAKATFLKIKSNVSKITPENLINLSHEVFRSFGVSRQKTTYLKALSEAILTKQIDLESLSTKSIEQIRAELLKIKGIGNWTIDVYLMFSLQVPDIIPLGDIAVVNTIKELLKIDDKVLIQSYVEKWSPHKSMATFLLWHYYLHKRNRKIDYNASIFR
jgi:DNA-3-methyladenine glycosylase II